MAQNPPAGPAPTEACSCDEQHSGISKDANGDPIFLILLDAVRESLEHRMQKCERGWRETRDPAFVVEALIWLYTHRQPLPAWLHEANLQLVVRRRTKVHRTRAYNAAIRMMRFEAVRDAKHTMPWKAAYRRAAEILAGTRAAAKASTMETDYKKVARDVRAGRAARYLEPKIAHGKTRGYFER